MAGGGRWGVRYIHNAAGVAAGLAALADQECSVSLALQQRLGLQPLDVAQLPGALVVVRQVLVVVHHRVLTSGRRRRKAS